MTFCRKSAKWQGDENFRSSTHHCRFQVDADLSDLRGHLSTSNACQSRQISLFAQSHPNTAPTNPPKRTVVKALLKLQAEMGRASQPGNVPTIAPPRTKRILTTMSSGSDFFCRLQAISLTPRLSCPSILCRPRLVKFPNHRIAEFERCQSALSPILSKFGRQKTSLRKEWMV